MRRRFAINNLSVIVACAAVGLYVAYAVDIFANEHHIPEKQAIVELDEALLAGGLLAVALLIFAIRLYRRQRQETQQRIAAERHARELAYQDGLTGLPNRRQFEEALQEAIGSPPRAGAAHALFMIDLNDFKQINDVHGHGLGDDVLIVVAERLLEAVREGDLVARFGGDEFAILARHLAGAEAATSVAARIIDGLKDPIVLGGTRHRVGAGLGVALLPQDADTVDEAKRKADVALYRAKAERRSTTRFFDPAMDASIHERASFEASLRDALAAGEIEPVFQPIVDLKTGRVTAFELKPRWRRGDGTTVPEERFVPVAEETGLIHAMAEDFLRAGLTAARSWPADVVLSVDIYPSQIKDQQLTARIVDLLASCDLPPARFELEIAESALVADPDGARRLLEELRGAGVRVVLDHFGTGYSSLYHLRNFKLDAVKIDRGFVEAMGADVESASIVQALAGLGQGLGLKVIADGVVTSGQEASLIERGCAAGQGPLFSAALTSAATTELFAAESAT